jgi:hypothetical protein
MSSHPLVPHPSTPCAAVRALAVDAHRAGETRLRLRYVLTGDLDRLRIAPQQPPRRADKLWQHTCFEAFVAAAGIEGYSEFNFAPSTEWAAYGFPGYRSGMTALDPAGLPRISVERGPERLALEAEIDLAALPGGRGELRLALSAVVEASDGSLSYWALRHPPGKPDFHHADGFTLKLAPETTA